jgi:pentatricopeptide repeat protein
MAAECTESKSEIALQDIVTYTTLLKVFGRLKDLNPVLKVVREMKSVDAFCLHRNN